MRPYFNRFFQSIHVSSWQIMLCVGIVVALVLFRVLCSRQKISAGSYNFYLLAMLVSLFFGFFSALFFQSLYDLPKKGSFEFGGMTVMGGLLGGAAAFLGFVAIFGKNNKPDFYKIVNISAPCIAAAHFLGRIGCFLGGCCYGAKTDSWLGVLFVDYYRNGEAVYHTDKRLPTQLFEAVFLALLMAVLLIILLKYKKNITMLIYMYSYSVFRFLLEFFRDDERGVFFIGLSPSQWQCIVMLIVAIGLSVYVYGFKKMPFGGKKNNNA